MSDQGSTTPGLRDVLAADLARARDEGATPWPADRRRPGTAEWLRSPAAYNELKRHHLTDEAGRCGCGERYTSHLRHLLDELATVAESG